MANHKVDLSGKQFGAWTVLRESSERRVQGQPEWICRCQCGTERRVSGANLRNGVSKSCGCVHRPSAYRTLLEYTRADDLTGRQFGRWSVLRRGALNDYGLQLWVCRCSCGTIKEVIGDNLRRGLSTSCGCGRVEKSNASVITHGMSDHPIYVTWQSMRNRCFNAQDVDFAHYGGRGITVCDRWADPVYFIADMLPTWKLGLSIERIDVNGHYEPGNCCWATQAEQMQNTRRTIKLQTPWGELSLNEAARRSGISSTALKARINRKWPKARLFDPPTR